jgi:hypothetical protein
VEYWISFWATIQTGRPVTLASGVWKALENGGISLTPLEFKDNYYTAGECDGKLALIGSRSDTYVDLSNYSIKTEIYNKTGVDKTLKDYYTTEECDNKFKEELDIQFENYYTADECDGNFALIDSGSDTGVVLSNYYIKTEIYNKTKVDEVWEDYYTAGSAMEKLR